MKKIRKKYGRLRKKNNVIVFPGAYEKMIEKGEGYVEQGNFEEAVELFDQVILYESNDPEFLVPYAVALYETKKFARAKEIAIQLLHSGTSNYIEAMELYLTISIQLQEYEEVELTIETLIGERVIPNELLQKFHYLRDLNNRLAKRYGEEDSPVSAASFTTQEFHQMDMLTQQNLLVSLEGTNLDPMLSTLLEIAASPNLSPLIITFSLTLLHQAGCTDEITVQKFGSKAAIIPAEMTLPGQDAKTEKVLSEIELLLLKDPSRFDLAKGLVEKFAIAAFPFHWGDYSSDEIATAYVQYIEILFGGEQVPSTPLLELIQQVDLIYETNLE